MGGSSEKETLETSGAAAPRARGANGRVGQTVAGYRVEGLAGLGGMGVVYRAVEPELGRHVALKLMAEDYTALPRYRELFKEESRKAAALEHPNVIPIYRSGEEDGQLFIAMRFIEGESLQELIERRGRLPLGTATRILSQTADALDAAHAQGLVHRDVKPGNILIADPEGDERVYLSDFGLAVRQEDTRLNGLRSGAGTPAYLAPEQIRGEPVDARTDVYALGCVLVHVLTGLPPFHGRDAGEAKIAHLTQPPPRLTDLVPGLPAGVNAVVVRAMAKRPEDRFASAGAFAAALRAARVDLVVVSHSDDAPAASSLVARLAAQGLEVRRAGAEPGDDLEATRACLVVVGRHGLGDWSRAPLSAVRAILAVDRDFVLASVLLPGAPDPLEPQLSFLVSRPAVDLRADLDDPHAVSDILRTLGTAPSTLGRAPAGEAGECPFRGLSPFEEDDAPLFFGRERETGLLVEKLRDARFLAVLGASGSGKSSLVRAGLVPALRRGATPWVVATVTPGAAPTSALAAQLEHTHGVNPGAPEAFLGDPRSLDRVAEGSRAPAASRPGCCWWSTSSRRCSRPRWRRGSGAR